MATARRRKAAAVLEHPDARHDQQSPAPPTAPGEKYRLIPRWRPNRLPESRAGPGELKSNPRGRLLEESGSSMEEWTIGRVQGCRTIHPSILSGLRSFQALSRVGHPSPNPLAGSTESSLRACRSEVFDLFLCFWSRRQRIQSTTEQS